MNVWVFFARTFLSERNLNKGWETDREAKENGWKKIAKWQQAPPQPSAERPPYECASTYYFILPWEIPWYPTFQWNSPSDSIHPHLLNVSANTPITHPTYTECPMKDFYTLAPDLFWLLQSHDI